MVSTLVKILAADVVLLLAEFLALQDLQWRSSYASSMLHLSPSFSYSVLTQVFNMAGSSVPLSSPLTLDWVQLIVVMLVGLNLWYAQNYLRRRRVKSVVPVASV